MVEVKVEELYRCAFETMRKELVQHDGRLEKEREDAKRRDADLCSQRPGDLLQNLVQTSVTKALTDLGNVTDTQDEPEEVDGEKNASDRKHNTGKRAIPWRGQGAQYKRERNEEEKYEKTKTQPRRKTTCKSQNRNKRQRKEARRGKARRAKPRTRARTRAKGKEQTKQANLHGKSLNQEEREKGKEAKEKDHECSESTVHEFGTRCDRNRLVPPP